MAIERRPPINICVYVCSDSIICIHARAQYTIALIAQICAYVCVSHIMSFQNIRIDISEKWRRN